MDKGLYAPQLKEVNVELEIKNFIIEKLTELLIKTDMEDKKKGKATYVKKTRCYKDLIKLVKECWEVKE